MTIPRFRPPRQTRSQATLDRILDAAERVFEEKSFSEATVAEIMSRAGVTVGAFYRRYPLALRLSAGLRVVFVGPV